MARDRKKIETALVSKGFLSREGDHHYFIYYGEDGKKKMAKTKTSHGTKGKTISDDLFSRMAKQVFLTNQRFADLVDCPLARAEYEAHLRGSGKL